MHVEAAPEPPAPVLLMPQWNDDCDEDYAAVLSGGV